MTSWKDNVFFVLVEPKEPGNIGASARAMKNMGFRNLCLVKPSQEMSGEGRWFARNAHDVLDSAIVYDSFEDTIRDSSIVVGVTRRRGKRRGVIMHADAGASRLSSLALSNSVAIVFGREARGLFNEEVEECGFVITIPSDKSQPSLNLSHAVMVIAYELYLAEYRRPWTPGEETPYVVCPEPGNLPALETHGDVSGLYERISGALELLDYIPRGDRNIKKKIMTNLKHFIGRAGLTEWELKMLLGLCRQIEKKVDKR